MGTHVFKICSPTASKTSNPGGVGASLCLLLYMQLTLAVLDRTHSLFSVVRTKKSFLCWKEKSNDSCLVSLSKDSSCQVYYKNKLVQSFESFKPAGLVSLVFGFHLRAVILKV